MWEPSDPDIGPPFMPAYNGFRIMRPQPGTFFWNRMHKYTIKKKAEEEREAIWTQMLLVVKMCTEGANRRDIDVELNKLSIMTRIRRKE